ncbi:SEC-C metal-binding domain-containing protein [Brevibacillus laterosporus]|uniref:YecA family protein n=1 Tax=Brevibacillus laterosporus TaxID=1465 RepID=UPI002157F56B|nr:SEC-C metal-binding domain-containing protein [Brevibacillus laterosporus]MCR8936614.1 SEC-C metal-binding domain-containing protein [Brevibacillus laterosporus]MCZ0839253.1 SEC-C metal-binding domain-containing protein [Brevibacillus laterosporus]MCZ0844117.1 SEC-C metal-binding domain-containing protein [Brevibacillus laterosporus]MED1910920.1 SEC-C metal-binding domain-containing protein [Brevibacillus laterosporus]
MVILDIGRNSLCPCGSGKKYKKCCLHKDEQRNYLHSSSTETNQLLHKYIDLELTWDNEDYITTAHNIVKSMQADYGADVVAAAVNLWHKYSHATQPVLRKAGIIEASIEYSIATIMDIPITQAALASKYNVSAGTISKRVQDILDNDWFVDQTHP